MADNVTLNTMSGGDTVAADDIGGVKHQRVKISQGADGSATDVSSAAPLHVTLANTGANSTPVVVDLGANNDVTVTGSVTANAGTNLNTSALALETTATSIKTAVETIDNAISGSEMQVDVITMPTTTVQATNLDIRDLTSTDVVTVTGGAGQTDDVKVTLDSESVAVTGTFWQATQPVSAASLPLPTGASTSANQTTIIGHLDGVEGLLTTIDTDTGTLAGAVSGTEVQVDVVGALPAGNNNIGDVDVASLPALPAGTNAIGKLLPNDVDVTTHTNYARKYYTNAGAVTDGIIWSPAAGKRWHVTTLKIQVSAACTVTIEDDLAAGDAVVDKYEFAANSGITLNFDKDYPLASAEDAADLLITTTAGNVYVLAVGYEV